MTKLRTIISILALLTCSSAFGGMTYEFSNRVDKGSGSMSGSAAIEGEKFRLELREGDDVLFKDGNVLVSTTGGRTFYVLDTKKKEYYEIDLDQIFSSLGALVGSMGGMVKISVENQKVNVTKGSDGGNIEGYATTKYSTDAAYDMVMEVFGSKNTISIKSQTETWVTDKIGTEFATFVQMKGFKTGLEGIDELLEQQTGNIKGFPLKSITKSTTTSKGKTQTSTSTMTVTSIKEADVPDDRFEIPPGYERVDGPMDDLQNMMKR